MPGSIACIVEGHAEVEALPALIRRIAAGLTPPLTVLVPPPLRLPKNQLLKLGELERATELAFRKVGNDGALLILLDSDDDCPAELGPTLLERARTVRPHLPMAVVLAKREFESWFVAAAASLRGLRGLPVDLNPPPDAEAIRGAKEWLSRHMPANRPCRATLDQPAMAECFDLNVAGQTASFQKCYREIVRLLTV